MTDLHFLDPNLTGDPAVLLLHGLGANAASWTLQLAPLMEAGYRPLAVDAPGFGESRYDGRGWTVKKSADALACLLDELAIPGAHVVGISMGGVIAQQFALDYPHLTIKLVLVNTFAAMKPTSLSSWLYLIVRMTIIHTLGMEAQARIVADHVFPNPEQASLRKQFIEQVRQADPRAYRAAMHDMIGFDSRPRLNELTVPTLVITSQDDTTVPPKNQRVLVDGIPGAKQLLVPNAGHGVSVDSFELFNRELLEFLG